ncbi:hypothetical protein EXIGLDRAFT_841730 [Exidia glandulosa HHB12029]|uniref:Phosphatidylglycerol/phosphatidylinositol transfer protein n=1 Tax=Exidia glandulosa HHB12029 TaxID=1314781 RepID=A0A165DPK0_EXIGL|nr:hypothetical protein EXIGLDRAFT_841730 [Exidia glandulosa HHB12029]
MLYMHFTFTTLVVVGLVQAQTRAAPQVVLGVDLEEKQCFPLTSDIVRYLVGDRIERYGEATFDAADYTIVVEARPEACLPRPVYVSQYDEIHCSDLGTFGRDDHDDCPDSELSYVYSTNLTIPSVSRPPVCLPIDFSVPAFAPSDGHVTVTTSPLSSEQGPTLCEASARVTLPMKVSLESLSPCYVDFSWLWLENKLHITAKK